MMEHPVRNGLRLVIHIDGASRGNPGRAAAGILIEDREGKPLAEIGRYLGHKTNNQAEYGALLLALGEAKRLGGDALHIFTDSELIERQINGIYRVKDVKLKALYQTAIENLKTFSSFKIQSIPRERNQEADRLANQAIDREIAKEKEGIQKGTDGRSS